MSAADPVQTLLALINGGQAVQAIPELQARLREQPGHPALLTLLAEAYRVAGRPAEAIPAYRQAGAAGGGSRNWLAAGILLADARQSDEALACLARALEESPDSDEILDALITTHFNVGRFAPAIEHARRQLALSRNPAYLKHAALLLQSNELYEESTAAFRKILALAGDDPALIGAALVPARFTCDWAWTEELQRKMLACYAAGDYAAPAEYPLTHVTWCADERINREVTRAYRERIVGAIRPLPRPGGERPPGRLRIGYLSCDFRNHATLHLMIGVFEQHDRERFEVFAYDYTTPDASEYRQRFLGAVEHHVDLRSLSDREAAERIAADRLDLLFDLKGYTGGARAGILAYRPAPLQVAYLGYPGSCASPDLDFIVGDRWVTPDSSLAHYSERFCRLPHSYQCNDGRRPIAPLQGGRREHGLPGQGVVYASFNQSYKIDRGSFALWLRVLQQVPDSVLWLLGQCAAAQRELSAQAAAAGIAAERLVFAPFALPQAHLARLQLADVVLDTLICNGHTTTSDALWAGVPVVTAPGRHFSSRVSASLLHAIGLPELVGEDPEAMLVIAVRLGRDADYRQQVRARLAEQRQQAPLFDAARFTRHFEQGILAMLAASPEQRCLDIPAELVSAPVLLPSLSPPPSLREPVPACPLCGGQSQPLGEYDCRMHPLWHGELPPTLSWQRCPDCAHVHTASVWSAAGLAALFRHANPAQLASLAAQHDSLRAQWAPVVERATRWLGGYAAVLAVGAAPWWVDVGCGDGALLMTAADFGYRVQGLDARSETAARVSELGYPVAAADFLAWTPPAELAELRVLSLMDVLEHLPDPRAALRHAHTLLAADGLLVLSLPDAGASSWQLLDRSGQNPYWIEIEHYHNFSRASLTRLLQECGFAVVDFAIPQRYRAQMEIYARRLG